MSGFAVSRFEVNKGRGVSPGVWKFEEFMFFDSVFGHATVEYDAQAVRRNETEWRIDLVGPIVKQVVVYNDDGVVIRDIPDAEQQELREIVIRAFEDVQDAVMEFERGNL